MTAADEGEAGTAGSHPRRVLAIRDRTESDLGECVRLLAEVHRRGGYPLRWPADPRRFLRTSKILAAWVATLDGQVVGHVALSAVSPGDAAPQLLGVASSGPASTHDPGSGRASSAGVADAATAGSDVAGSDVAGSDVAGSDVAGSDVAGSGGAGDSWVVGTGKVVMISRLFVATAARGYGAGRALMQRAVQAAHERSQHPLLDVHTANTSAIALYERLGWNFLGTSHAQWGSDRVTIRSYTAPPQLPA